MTTTEKIKPGITIRNGATSVENVLYKYTINGVVDRTAMQRLEINLTYQMKKDAAPVMLYGNHAANAHRQGYSFCLKFEAHTISSSMAVHVKTWVGKRWQVAKAGDWAITKDKSSGGLTLYFLRKFKDKLLLVPNSNHFIKVILGNVKPVDNFRENSFVVFQLIDVDGYIYANHKNLTIQNLAS